MAQPDSLTNRISANYPDLSGSAQTIANFLQQNPFAVVSLSVAELAIKTQTSKATVSRFFRQLGYSSHQEAKQALLSRRTGGLPIHEFTEPTPDFAAQEHDLILRTFQGMSEQRLDGLVERFCKARHLVLIGYRNSYPVAMHFRQQLKQLRGKVHVYPRSGQTIAEDLIDLHADDLVVLIGFRRRPRIFSTLVQSLNPAQIVLFTDVSGQIYNKDVSELIVCHLGESQALDSYAAPMALISAITNRMYQHLGDSAHQRINAISQRYDDYGELD